MNNSSNNSKPQNSRLPLSVLLDELRDAEPNAPISVRQALVLAAALVNLQNVVVSVMDTMDANTETMNVSHENMNVNFIHMLAAIKQIGAAAGIEIQGINKAIEEKVEAVELPPPGTVKH